MNSVLISGVNGFVGKNLKAYLSKSGYKVLGLSRNTDADKSSDSNNISWSELPKIKDHHLNAMIHLAGLAHDINNKSNDLDYFNVNTDLTKSLYDVFLVSDTECFIFLSSVKAVKDSVDDILTEDVIPDPGSVYGKSKLKAEQYLLSQSLPPAKRLYILRPCMIHGPGNKGNLNQLYHFVRRRLPYPLASFENKRSFLSIDNLCFVMERLITDASIPSGIYHLADDEALSSIDVIKTISEALSVKPRMLALPKSFVKAIARIGDVIGLQLNSQRLKKLTESYVVSNDKIKNALHLEYFPVTSRAGLRKTIENFKGEIF